MRIQEQNRIIALFDVDGTLTPSRRKAGKEILPLLKSLRSKIRIGFVGGSDLSKQIEQIGPDVLDLFDYSFPENGLVYYKGQQLMSERSFVQEIGEETYMVFVNWCLEYISRLQIPKKRGTFVELRKGLVNICPIGRSCTQEERDEFYRYDLDQGIREKMVSDMRQKFKGLPLHFSIGGQISIDAFPVGWDKRYCLKHLEGEGFEEIHFFGDKTAAGGNDHEIYNDSRVKGHAVKSPEDTVKLVKSLFFDEE